MKKKLISVVSVMALAFGTCTVAMAAGSIPDNATRNNIKSSGNIVYMDGEHSVEIYSDDLLMLADQLDSFKTTVSDQLGEMNTYFSTGKQGTGTVSDSNIKIVHTVPSEGETVDPLTLDFDTLLEGLAASQSIPADVTEYGYADGTILYKTSDGELTTDSTQDNVEQISILAATPGNISAGNAAWVNGELVLGTGSDNKAYYKDGYSIGYADGVAGSLSNAGIEYVYHTHTNSCQAVCSYKRTVYQYSGDTYAVTESGHTCSGNLNGTRCYQGKPSESYGTSYLSHNYYVCGKTTATIESAIITFQ